MRAGRATAVALLLGAVSGAAQEPGAVPGKAEGVDAAIARAVGFLVGLQDREGAIADRGHNQTAMTALAVLALAAVGHQPTDETREGAAMRRALDFVLRADRQDPQGYFGARDGSRMYGHGIVTLMLSEMLGMGVDAQQDQVLRERARRAVDLILRSQAIRKDARNAGGWRYNPDSPDSDLSVTVWQVMALRSARNAGLEVPREAIEQAVGYLRRCYYSKRDEQGRPVQPKSAFAYEPNRAPEYAMASAGLLAMQVCGEYDAPEVAGAAEWLKERPLEFGGEWFFYGTYYYAQGMYQRGGEYAAHARRAVEGALLPNQDPDGAWRGRHGQERDAGRVYATSLAVLSLAVKHHYLPIYQR